MRRSGGKRVLALVLALTVFLTSGFFVLFGDKVFGARNTTSPNTATNPYVKEGEALSTTVGVRGTTESGNIMLTDEGSNVQGKTPVSRQRGWSPAAALDSLLSAGSITQAEYNELKVNIDSLGDGFMVPGTDDNIDSNGVDKKGSEGNPFLLLEVVPDKAMQELTYFSGSEDSGLPFDQGGMSATMMEQVRATNTDKTYRFVNRPDLVADVVQNIKTPIENLYGNWTVKASYEVFNIGRSDEGNQFATSQLPLYSCESGTTTTEKQGYFDVNELYNFDVTTDDLLEKDPVKKEVKYNYYGDVESITYKENEPSEYTLCVAAGIPGAVATMTNEALVNNFKTYLYGNVELDHRDIHSDKKYNDGKGRTPHTTALIKYNLTQPYLMANGIYGADFKKHFDVVSPGSDAEGSYDVAWSRLGRSASKPTKDADGNPIEGDTFWRLLFRKYYVDHFEDLYNELISYDTFWKFKMNNGSVFSNYSNAPDSFKEYITSQYGEEMKEYKKSVNWNPSDDDCLREVLTRHGYDQNKNESHWLSKRDEVLQKLLKEYRPLFEDKGVNIAAIKDYMDWDTSQSDILSKTRTYQAEPAGGYVLAVKPGMGDMYLITDKDKIISMGGSENDIVFARDKKAPTFYTQDQGGHKKGDVKELGDPEMRWIYVPSNYALNGANPSGTVNSDKYMAGYLDDSRYTLGFASKTISNLNDMWYAIYDRYNRKYHGGNNFDTFSKKMLIDTDQNGVWDPYDQQIDDTEHMYRTYDNGLGQSTDGYHLNVLKQVFGSNPNSWEIRNRIYGANNNAWTSIFGNNLDSLGGLIAGENNKNQKIDNILMHDDLIDSNGYSWFNFNGSTPVKLGKDEVKDSDGKVTEKSVPWLYDEYNGEKITASKYITGLCFNFNDIRMRTMNSKIEVNRRPDIYNIDMLNDDGVRTNPNANGYDADDYHYHFSDYEMRPTYKNPNNAQLLADWHSYGWTDAQIADMHPEYTKDSRYMETWHSYGRTDVDNFITDYPLKESQIPSAAGLDLARVNDRNFHVNSFWDHNITNSGKTKNRYKNGQNDAQNIINDTARNIEKERFSRGDNNDVVLVDRDQVVTEKVKNYHFTYYGFGANDILKRSLFNFTGANGQQKFKDFHYRVLCVTPAEMNAISTIAKKINAVASTTGEILFDLSERADMFYIHTLKSRKIIGQDDMSKAFRFYSDVVKGDNTTRTIEGMNSFFENDLEWDQVLKIIKRSSNPRYGSNLPIIFNGMVANMSVENADPVKPEDAKTESEAEDTAMYLYDQDPSKIWNGNLNNISKMYLILIQFDLQAIKNSLINKEETDRTKQVRIQRTFMKDIFPYLMQAPISDTYDSGVTDNILKRVPGSAKYTGYVQAADQPTNQSWGRKLASSAKVGDQDAGEQFLRNTLSLWNMYTFYPYGTKLENKVIDYVAQGYLASYCRPNCGDEQDVFGVNGAYRYRTGSDGMDGQNVYVYKISGDEAGTHADSLISKMGHNGFDTNIFLSIAYNIMHNGGEPEDVEIQVMPRNQKYTTLGLDSGNPPHSNVMLDYYKDTSMYDPVDLEELRGQEKNLKIKALNPNNEIAVVTEIDVYKDGTFVSGSFIPESSFVSGDSGEYREPIRYFGEPLDGERSLKDMLKANNRDSFGTDLGQELCEVTGNTHKYRGMRIESGDELVFHIPYLLDNYFDGYDRIRVKGKYWVRVRKKQDGLMVDNIELRDFEHIININEMDMFMLE